MRKIKTNNVKWGDKLDGKRNLLNGPKKKNNNKPIDLRKKEERKKERKKERKNTKNK